MASERQVAIDNGSLSEFSNRNSQQCQVLGNSLFNRHFAGGRKQSVSSAGQNSNYGGSSFLQSLQGSHQIITNKPSFMRDFMHPRGSAKVLVKPSD